MHLVSVCVCAPMCMGVHLHVHECVCVRSFHRAPWWPIEWMTGILTTLLSEWSQKPELQRPLLPAPGDLWDKSGSCGLQALSGCGQGPAQHPPYDPVSHPGGPSQPCGPAQPWVPHPGGPSSPWSGLERRRTGVCLSDSWGVLPNQPSFPVGTLLPLRDRVGSGCRVLVGPESSAGVLESLCLD